MENSREKALPEEMKAKNNAMHRGLQEVSEYLNLEALASNFNNTEEWLRQRLLHEVVDGVPCDFEEFEYDIWADELRHLAERFNCVARAIEDADYDCYGEVEQRGTISLDVDQSIIDDVKCGRRTAICKTLFPNNLDMFVFDDAEYEDESDLQAIPYEYLTLVSDRESLTVKLRDSQYYELCREDGREVLAVENGVKFAMAQVIYIIEQRPYKLEVTY